MAATEKKRVLLVDDDEQFSQLICATLRMSGVEPVAVLTLADGLGAVKTMAFHMVLLDLALPDSPLGATFARIRDFLLNGAECVVIITGTDVVDTLREKAVGAGAIDIIGKDDPKFSDKLTELVTA